VLGVIGLGSALAFAGDLLRLTYNVPGDAKAIVVHADQMASWVEGSRRILLARGRVLIEHGAMQTRADQAVAWIDQQQFKKTGILQFEFYAEGNVTSENGPEIRSAPSAFIEISTRGEVKLKAYSGKVVQQPQPDDPIYRRAQDVRVAQGKPPTTEQPIRQTSFQQVAPSVPQMPNNQPVPQPQITPIPPPTGQWQASQQQQPSPQQQQQQLPPQQQQPSPQQQQQQLPPQQQQEPPKVPADQSIMPTIPPEPGAVPPVQTPTPPPVPNVRPSAIPFPNQPPRTGATGPLGGPIHQYSIVPRTSAGFEQQSFLLNNGEYVVVVAGGVILLVRTGDNTGLLDIEADRLVFWTKDNPQKMLSGLRSPQGQAGRNLEFYMSGNVEIRQRNGPQDHTLRANEVYYDVNRHVAVAMQADIEFKQKGIPDPIHLKAEELLQLSPTMFQAMQAEIFSSRLPSDPGLKVYVANTTIEEKKVPKKSIFGPIINKTTGQPETEDQRLFESKNVYVEIQDVPVLYLPFLRGDANDPLGPLQNVNVGYDRIFGARLQTTWNMYDLLGITPVAGTKWRLDVDYLSLRGPALGTNYDYSGKSFLGIPVRQMTGEVKAYGIIDNGTDILGGGRGPDDNHPVDRGRFLWRQNVLDLPGGFTLQTQLAALSDMNFLEQYYKNEFDNDPNQETFVYLKQQQSNWAWTVLTEPYLRNWVTETEWLPRADGYLLGQSFLDVGDNGRPIFTYNVHASTGYARLRTTDNVPPPVVSPTDVTTNTIRSDLSQELSAPFTLGAFRIVPYGVLDLTYYTRDLAGNAQGRVYEGGGVRASIPFTRIYPDVQSDLLNLNGINHKIVLSGNYYYAHSDVPFTDFPQLDRLNDDATDQSIRQIRPLEPAFNPTHGVALATSPLYDPQLFAIHRLIDDRIDTLDDVEVFQADLRQRWQTKRGYPGQQHIVDWMTLDVSGSFFANVGRDKMGEDFSYFDYDWNWNIGDRTALFSSGWFDPHQNGPRVFSFGASLNRPDRTNFYLGYRQIDLLNSQAVTGAVTYIFSPKYAMTASTTYDFGTNIQTTAVVFTRMGSDLMLSLGLTHNSLLNTVGVTFEIVPNVAALAVHRAPGSPGVGLLGSPVMR
jgi:hypothetical protein